MDDKEKFYLIRNLKDSGCNKKMIDEYLQIEDEENFISSRKCGCWKENLEKICELKNKEYKIYFLSNITDVSYNYLNDKLNILDMVDGGIYSCKEHLKKPSKEIFDTLIKRFDLNKEETIFFDDSQKNVKAGNEYGIKSYVFNSIKDITTLEL